MDKNIEEPGMKENQANFDCSPVLDVPVRNTHQFPYRVVLPVLQLIYICRGTIIWGFPQSILIHHSLLGEKSDVYAELMSPNLTE